MDDFIAPKCPKVWQRDDFSFLSFLASKSVACALKPPRNFLNSALQVVQRTASKAFKPLKSEYTNCVVKWKAITSICFTFVYGLALQCSWILQDLQSKTSTSQQNFLLLGYNLAWIPPKLETSSFCDRILMANVNPGSRSESPESIVERG